MKTTNENWPRWPHYAKDEVQAVEDILCSGKVNYWTADLIAGEDSEKLHGECGLFAKEFAQYLGVDYACCVANGTLALELCLYAMGIGNGDEVIVPNRVFIATASACSVRGAVPVFADVDINSGCMTLETIKAAVTPKTKAIICVHLAGWACEMDKIMEFARENNLKVIEDCAQAHGGKYKGKMLGSFGDMAAISFCQDKIISTGGEGGMVATNNGEFFKRAWSYKDHGKDFNKFNYTVKHPLADNDNAVASYYTSVGTNFRLTQMQAAIGRRQLAKLPQWVERRRQFAAMYNDAFKDIDGIRITVPPDDVYHCYYIYYFYLELDKLAEGWSRDRFTAEVAKSGVVCRYGSPSGLGLEDAWKDIRCTISGNTHQAQLSQPLEADNQLKHSAVMLEVHPYLTPNHINKAIEAVKSVMERAHK